MEVSNNLPVTKLPETALVTQNTRQRYYPNWRPAGFERYQYFAALEDEMPLVTYDGGITGTAQRYAPVGSLETTASTPKAKRKK